MANMVVRTNVFALNAHRNMRNVGADQQRASQRLSSGYRINSAADDAAGLAISETMRAQIRGLDQASRNAQDGQALINTAEGGMQEIQNMFQRVRELLVQASNDTNTDTNRDQINLEMAALLEEVDAMASRVEFNGMTLLDGSYATTALFFQIGANSDQNLTVNIEDMRLDEILSRGTGISAGDLDISGVTTGEEIHALIDEIQGALDDISMQRAKLGAVSNRLDFTTKSLEISSENLSDAESRVRNTDMAKEMMNFTMANVLQQAAVSMLAQANQLPNNLLQLLR